MLDINWSEIIIFFLSNAVLLATGFINMQIKLSNLDIRLSGFEKSMDKLVSKVETLDKHQLELHTKVAQYETRLEIVEKHCDMRRS
jgi:peptidoglycan hydrolase CwlO-like protein